MKQEAELIYHWVAESPWASSRAQPCCKDRLCWNPRTRGAQSTWLIVTRTWSPVSSDMGTYLWGINTQGGQAFEELKSLFLALTEVWFSRPSPCWDFSQDVFGAQFLQDIFLLAENRVHTKLNEAKAYHLYTLQKRHHHHCQVKTWKPSRRQNNLCSPSGCCKSTALSRQQKWIW